MLDVVVVVVLYVGVESVGLAVNEKAHVVHARSRHAGILSQFPSYAGPHDAWVVVLSVEVQVFYALNSGTGHKAVERNFKRLFGTGARGVSP